MTRSTTPWNLALAAVAALGMGLAACGSGGGGGDGEGAEPLPHETCEEVEGLAPCCDPPEVSPAACAELGGEYEENRDEEGRLWRKGCNSTEEGAAALRVVRFDLEGGWVTKFDSADAPTIGTICVSTGRVGYVVRSDETGPVCLEGCWGDDGAEGGCTAAGSWPACEDAEG